MKCVLCLVALFAFFSNAVVADDASAKLILIKEVLNDIITEGNDLSVQYSLFNIGDGPATDVELADSDFHESEFELVSGMTSVKWERIGANSNVSHVVVVKPLKASAFNSTSAVVQYVASEGAEPTFGFSDELGEMSIISATEYKRLHASHVWEWFLFSIFCIPSLLLPYLLHFTSKSKYNALSAKKKH